MTNDLVLEDGTVILESERQKTEVWSRCMGYFRPVTDWNIGKRQEFKDRKMYNVDSVIEN